MMGSTTDGEQDFPVGLVTAEDMAQESSETLSVEQFSSLTFHLHGLSTARGAGLHNRDRFRLQPLTVVCKLYY